MRLLQNPEIHEKATNAIQTYLEENDCPESIDQMHSHLVHALNKGRKMIPTESKTKYKIPWLKDNLLTSLAEQRRGLCKKKLTSQIQTQLKQLRKKDKEKGKRTEQRSSER